MTDIPALHSSVEPLLADALSRVVGRFDQQLASPLMPVADLVRHVERYRGKMLRPTLVLLSGLACAPGSPISDAHITVAAVVEMIHLATLVHDDVLDEAEVRRGARTINALKGNEAAVILGDYLISKSFHLCSTLESQRTALRIGEVTSIVCEGEMLQLTHRADLTLDERTYFEIIERKTAALIAVACELGAHHAGVDAALCRRLHDFGIKLGVAFQIQDDLLDLVGEEAVVGKSLGKDLEKEKLTLPVIHHLAGLPPSARMQTERLIHRNAFHNGARSSFHPQLDATGSIAYARGVATRLVREAQELLAPLPESPAKACMLTLAEAVITRAY